MKEGISFIQRKEIKYRLTKEQLDYFLNAIKEYVKEDEYGLTSIASIYFDTPNYTLINRSLDKPLYKEKIRLRSYGLVSKDSPTYLEVKRKVNGVVYKRRIQLTEEEANYMINNKVSDRNDQVSKELLYLANKYQNLKPCYLIIYDRLSFYQEDSDIRITIDKNPRYRVDDINLHTSMEGKSLINKEEAILEVKVQNALPLWLAAILTKGHIYESSFSKVGEAHKAEMKDLSNKVTIPHQVVINQERNYHYGLTI